jgi:ABC-2 type transport system ATP-binding protein
MNTSESAAPAIELDALGKTYAQTQAVDGVSLVIPSGTFFGLIGPNGAGKSTTIKMLMGMLRPSSGRCRVLGLDPERQPSELKSRVGYVPETHQIYRWMRIAEVIAFVRPFYKDWDDGLCSSLLDLFALDPRKKVKQLSKGMLAKLA